MNNNKCESDCPNYSKLNRACSDCIILLKTENDDLKGENNLLWDEIESLKNRVKDLWW